MLCSRFYELMSLLSLIGEQLRRVDENVDTSLLDVQAGHEALQTYWRRLSSNQGLVMKVFAVLFCFIVAWGAFFA